MANWFLLSKQIFTTPFYFRYRLNLLSFLAVTAHGYSVFIKGWKINIYLIIFV